MKSVLAVVIAVLVAGVSPGAVPDLDDSFDVLYGNGYTFDVPSNGWHASSAAAMVTNGGYSGQSVVLSGTVGLTNTLGTDSGLKIWTDMRIKPQLGSETAAVSYTNTSSLVCYFTTNGYVAVATAQGLQACSNDVWGGVVPPVSNEFVRVSIFQDYNTHIQAVFLNGQLIVQDVPFSGTYSGLSRLGIDNSHDDCWLDEVWAKTNIGPDGVVNDRNGNGTNDALEVYQFGYAGRTQYVGSVGYPVYTNIAAAVNVGRPLDIIYVPGGAYTGDVTVLSAIRFAGSAFTNIGSLSVGTAASAFFPMATTWDAVTLDSNSVATFSQALLCSSLVVRAGATVVLQSLTCTNLLVEAGATVSVAAGRTVEVGSASVAGGMHMTGSSMLSVTETLILTGSGRIEIEDSRIVVTGSGVDMTGTFVLDAATWGMSVTVPLPFSDGFEDYAPGSMVSRLGFRGWYASDDAGIVQAAIKRTGEKALDIPPGTAISNRVNSGGTTKVWTDFVFRPSPGAEPPPTVTNGRSFVAYVNTNGALVVATNGGWLVCASNIINTAPVVLTSNDFSRITVFSDLSNHTFAVFVNSNLVVQGLGSPTGLDAVSVFGIDNPADADVHAYVDDVLLATNVATGTSDLDLDGMADAEEIDLYGDITFMPKGVIFLFR